jgi:hypothetical protein
MFGINGNIFNINKNKILIIYIMPKKSVYKEQKKKSSKFKKSVSSKFKKSVSSRKKKIGRLLSFIRKKSKMSKQPTLMRKQRTLMRKQPMVTRKQRTLMRKQPTLMREKSMLMRKQPTLMRKPLKTLRRKPLQIYRNPVSMKSMSFQDSKFYSSQSGEKPVFKRITSGIQNIDGDVSGFKFNQDNNHQQLITYPN